MKYDAVLEGGGVKIPGLVGALAGIETRGFQPSHLAGTSAGAIVAAGRAAGYTPDELLGILLDTDFRKFMDGDGWGRKAYNVVRHRGIYRGDYFYNFMKDMLKEKGVVYFGDLTSPLPEDAQSYKYRWTFKCFSADITNEQLITFPDDAAIFGFLPDYMEVALAVRCSMSIPFFFRPVELNENLLVDGGALSNYPIWVWDSYEAPEWPTFGVLLDEDIGSGKRNEIGRWPHEFFMALMSTMMKAHDRRFIRPGDFQHRTIKVPVGDTKTTDFGISQAKRQLLFNSGYKSAKEFLREWTFADYRKWAMHVRGISGESE